MKRGSDGQWCILAVELAVPVLVAIADEIRKRGLPFWPSFEGEARPSVTARRSLRTDPTTTRYSARYVGSTCGRDMPAKLAYRGMVLYYHRKKYENS